MNILFAMPGGGEWILIILAVLWAIVMPILAIVFYIQNKQLKKQVEKLTDTLIHKK